jgi:hypothetical protein
MKLKCDDCKKQKVAECIEYVEVFCAAGHWEGNDGEEPKTDPWENCEDYEPKEKVNELHKSN